MVYTPEFNPFASFDGAANWIENVEGYDEARETLIYPRVRAWMNSLEPGSTIADIGAGQGVCSQFAPEDIEYVGIEPSRYLVERANKLYGITPNRRFVSGSAEAIPLADDSVDAVMSTHVWFHLPDVAKPSREIARILKPGGTLFMTTANPDAYDWWQGQYAGVTESGKMVRGSLHYQEHVLHDSVFFRHTSDEIFYNLAIAGFHDIQIEGFGLDGRQSSLAVTAALRDDYTPPR